MAPILTESWCSSSQTTSVQLQSTQYFSRRFRPVWTARISPLCCCRSCRASHTQEERSSEVNARQTLRKVFILVDLLHLRGRTCDIKQSLYTELESLDDEDSKWLLLTVH